MYIKEYINYLSRKKIKYIPKKLITQNFFRIHIFNSENNLPKKWKIGNLVLKLFWQQTSTVLICVDMKFNQAGRSFEDDGKYCQEGQQV